MITGKGIGFLVAVIALLLLGRLTQVGWLYLVDAVLWGIIALSAIFPWLGVAFITAQRKIEAPNSSPVAHGPVGSSAQSAPSTPRNSVVPSASPTEGDPVRITLSLGSRAFWPSYLLNIYYECAVAPPDNRLHRLFVSNVFRNGQASGKRSGQTPDNLSGPQTGPQTMEITVDAYQRGLHHLGPVVIESTAPFVLFRRRRKLTRTEPVLVYPQVQPMRRLAMAQGFSGMESQGKEARTGTDPLGTRPYAPGDSRRNIHWRNSAKTGQLMVKELEDPLDRTTFLLFDATRVWGEGRETTLEYAIKLVASVANFAQRSHLPVQVLGGGLSNGRSTQAVDAPSRVPMPWPKLLKQLAMVNPGDGAEMAENLAKLPLGASAVAVVSAADRSALQSLAKASSSLRTLVLVSLEGFGEDEKHNAMHPDDLRSLLAAKIAVIPCQPGQLKQALDALSSRRVEGRGNSFTTSEATQMRTAYATSQVGSGEGQSRG